MNSSLSHRLQRARGRLFVGRCEEISCWKEALHSESWPVPIWHVSGFGGIGKTSLLREWKQLALGAGIGVVAIDARDISPTPNAFCEALTEALGQMLGQTWGETRSDSSSEASQPGAGATATPFSLSQALQNLGRVVVQIDTVELLAPLDHWLRNSFLPLLTANVAVVLAGRDELPLSWRSDAGWQELVRSFALRPLSREQGAEYLARRGVEVTERPDVLRWTHGHPLALSLAADLCLAQPVASSSASSASPQSSTAISSVQEALAPLGFEALELSDNALDLPQLVGPLLRHLVRDVPSPAHRAALESCAIVSVLTEELLREMLGSDFGTPLDSHEIFEWLRCSSVVSANRFGLFPHDLVREILVADLRWRSPAWHSELHRRAREYYLRGVHRATGVEQQRMVFNCIFLHRASPVVAPFLHWQDTHCTLEIARRAEWDELLGFIEKHEGLTSRRIAQRWFEAQPQGLIVVKNAEGKAQGLLFQLALHQASEAQIEADPGALAAWNTLQTQAPLRDDEGATVFRFWLDKDLYQAVSPTQSLIFVQAVRHYITTPGLAFSFFPCASPDFWEAGFGYADVPRLPRADFEIDGHTFGNFGHDWRARPLISWFELLSQREMELQAALPPAEEIASEPIFGVLDEVAFLSAVRLALRDWNDTAALRRSALLNTAMVHRRARQLAVGIVSGNGSGISSGNGSSRGVGNGVGRGDSRAVTSDERILALRSLLREALAELAVVPRQDRAYRALELVFGRAALAQEAAADVMNVSHSSFKRYLRAAQGFIGQSLWRRELLRGGSDDTFSRSHGAENEPHLNLF